MTIIRHSEKADGVMDGGVTKGDRDIGGFGGGILLLRYVPRAPIYMTGIDGQDYKYFIIYYYTNIMIFVPRKRHIPLRQCLSQT